VLRQAFPHPGDQCLPRDSAARDADDDLRQAAASLEVLECGKNLLEGQVARDAEDD